MQVVASDNKPIPSIRKVAIPKGVSKPNAKYFTSIYLNLSQKKELIIPETKPALENNSDNLAQPNRMSATTNGGEKQVFDDTQMWLRRLLSENPQRSKTFVTTQITNKKVKSAGKRKSQVARIESFLSSLPKALKLILSHR